MRAPALRCGVCGGPAFDCKCWQIEAHRAFLAQPDAHPDCEHCRRAREGAVALLAKLVTAGGASLPLFAQAQTAYPDCPASATCVYLLLPTGYSLSAADGALLGAAIMGVWAAAALFKWLVRSLRDDGERADD